jgi:hypothetical protein
MKKLFVLLVIVGILYGLYSAGMAGHSYVTISGVMDEAVPRQIGDKGVSDQFAAKERDDRIRKAVAENVTAAGITIGPENIAISEEGGKLFVQVSHQYPVIVFQGETKAAIPVSVTSSFQLPPPRPQ